MESNADHCGSICAMRCDLATVVSDAERPALTHNRHGREVRIVRDCIDETRRCCWERDRTAIHRICLSSATTTCAAEEMAGTVVRSDSNHMEHKSQAPSKTAGESSSDTRSEIEQVLADVSVVMKADVKPIVESGPMKLIITLQSNIVKDVEFTFEDAL